MDAKIALLTAIVAIGAAQSPAPGTAAPPPHSLPMAQVKNYPAARIVTFSNDRTERILVVVVRFGFAKRAQVSFPDHPRSVQPDFLSPHEFRDVAVVRYLIEDCVDVSSWTWHYSHLTQTLRFGSKSFALTPPAIAIFEYDEHQEPTLELRPFSTEAADHLPLEFGDGKRDPFLLSEERIYELENGHRRGQPNDSLQLPHRRRTESVRSLRSRFLRFPFSRRSAGN